MNKDKIISGKQDVYVPAHLNFGKYMLDQLRRKGAEVALENGETGEKLSYNELTEYAVKLSVALTKLGVRKGDVVALGSEIRLMFVPTALAIVLSGAIYTCYEFDSGREHLKYKMAITKPKYFICTELFWKTNKELLQNWETVQTFMTLDDSSDTLIPVSSLVSSIGDVDLNLFEPVRVQGQIDIAAIFYSSGTSGMPKGVQLSHLRCILDSLPLEPTFDDDSVKVAFVSGDWFHTYEAFMTYKMFAFGKKVVFITHAVPPETLLAVYQKTEVNLAFLLPADVNLLTKAETKQNNKLQLKYIYCAGAPIHEKTLKKFTERFHSLKYAIQGYGMTETAVMTSTCWATKGIKLSSVGTVAPCISLKVENPDTQEVLGPNQRGQICVRGLLFMNGYVNVDPSTYLDGEGWFRTGDVGYYDDDGYFYIVDRLKEFICYHSNKVAPLELETILQLHPGVLEAAAVGKPVPVYGEEPTAFVVRRPGSDVTEQELVDFVADKVAPYMQLKGGVRFISNLPKNSIGKILRRTLREILNRSN